MTEEQPKQPEVVKGAPPQAQKGDVQGLNDLIQAVIPLAREYIDFKKTEFKVRDERIGTISKHNRHLTYSLLFFLFGVVGLTTVLTLFGKVSSDALLFLAGTIVGYMIVWVQNLIFAPAEEPSESL